MDPYSKATRNLNRAMVEVARGELIRVREIAEEIEAVISESNLELAWDNKADWRWVRQQVRKVDRGSL